MSRLKYSDLFSCDAPVEIIYKTLGIEMDSGRVKFSAPAQKHAFDMHPNDFPMIVPHLVQLLTNPLYLGDDFRNPGRLNLSADFADTAALRWSHLQLRKMSATDAIMCVRPI